MPQIHHAFDIARPHGSRHRFLLGLRVHVASSALQTRQAVPVVATEERIKPRPGMANGCRRWPALRKGGWGGCPDFWGALILLSYWSWMYMNHPVVILRMWWLTNGVGHTLKQNDLKFRNLQPSSLGAPSVANHGKKSTKVYPGLSQECRVKLWNLTSVAPQPLKHADLVPIRMSRSAVPRRLRHSMQKPRSAAWRSMAQHGAAWRSMAQHETWGVNTTILAFRINQWWYILGWLSTILPWWFIMIYIWNIYIYMVYCCHVVFVLLQSEKKTGWNHK